MTNRALISLVAVVLSVATGHSQVPAAILDPDVKLMATRGGIYTNRWYLDFDINFEFRVLEPGRKGAAIVRSRFGEGAERAGYAINLSDKTDGRDALARVSSRPSSAMRPGLHEEQFDTQRLSSAMKAAGEWQQVRIVSDGYDVRVFVNDALITIVAAVPLAGHIGVEGVGRDIELRQLRVLRRDTYLQPLPPSGGNFVYVSRADYDNKSAALPKVIREVKPSYSSDALYKRVAGVVYMEGIVLTDGTVGPVRVTKSLDVDLDQDAVGSLKQWRFKPALKDGQPIAARVEVEMSYKPRK